MRKIIVIIVSIPLLFFMLLFDIIKFPIVVFFLFPIFFYLHFIDWLRGGSVVETVWEMLWETATIGFQTWREIIE